VSNPEWIPLPEDRYLPAGHYLLLWRDGMRTFFELTHDMQLTEHITHYFPEPVMPEPEPEVQP